MSQRLLGRRKTEFEKQGDSVIRHCVMFKWKPGTDEDAKKAIAAGLDQMATLDMVVAYRHGPDVGLSEGSWDYVVVGDFASADDYRSYASDPRHTAFIADKVAAHVADRAAVQYEMGREGHPSGKSR